jgi:hypothetical protein
MIFAYILILPRELYLPQNLLYASFNFPFAGSEAFYCKAPSTYPKVEAVAGRILRTIHSIAPFG